MWWRLTIPHLFPKFGQLWSGGFTIPSGDVHHFSTDALVVYNMNLKLIPYKETQQASKVYAGKKLEKRSRTDITWHISWLLTALIWNKDAIRSLNPMSSKYSPIKPYTKLWEQASQSWHKKTETSLFSAVRVVQCFEKKIKLIYCLTKTIQTTYNKGFLMEIRGIFRELIGMSSSSQTDIVPRKWK